MSFRLDPWASSEDWLTASSNAEESTKAGDSKVQVVIQYCGG